MLEPWGVFVLHVFVDKMQDFCFFFNLSLLLFTGVSGSHCNCEISARIQKEKWGFKVE